MNKREIFAWTVLSACATSFAAWIVCIIFLVHIGHVEGVLSDHFFHIEGISLWLCGPALIVAFVVKEFLPRGLFNQ